MGLLSRIFSRKSASVMDSAALMKELFGSEARSGVVVSTATALECATVLACVRVIANGLAQVPFKLHRVNGRHREAATGHPLFDLIDTAPNDYQTAFEFRQMLGLHLALTGNAHVWLNRVGGRIVEMLPYRPGSVTVTRAKDWSLRYTITTLDGERVEVPASDMWHLRWLSWDGVAGLDAVRLTREAIGLSLATEKHGARLFKNGAAVGGLLSTDSILTEEQVKRLKENWQAAHSGDNTFKTAVMFGGMKFTPTGSPNDEAQFLETRRHQVEEICRGYGVSPIMVFHYDKASTYASAEQMFLQHAVHTLGPWYACIEKSAARWLLTPEERGQGYYFKFNANGLMRGAARDRAEFYKSLYNVGALSPNDIRELEDMNPYDGGDEYRVPLNMEEPGAEPEKGEDSDGKA